MIFCVTSKSREPYNFEFVRFYSRNDKDIDIIEDMPEAIKDTLHDYGFFFSPKYGAFVDDFEYFCFDSTKDMRKTLPEVKFFDIKELSSIEVELFRKLRCLEFEKKTLRNAVDDAFNLDPAAEQRLDIVDSLVYTFHSLISRCELTESYNTFLLMPDIFPKIRASTAPEGVQGA